MNKIIEICKKKIVHEVEAKYVVEQYIKDKKGVDISIDLNNNSFFSSPKRTMNLLFKAFEYASAYYLKE